MFGFWNVQCNNNSIKFWETLKIHPRSKSTQSNLLSAYRLIVWVRSNNDSQIQTTNKQKIAKKF